MEELTESETARRLACGDEPGVLHDEVSFWSNVIFVQ